MGDLRYLRPRVVSLVGVCVAVPLLLGQGCPSFGTGGAPTVTIQTPTLDQTVTLGATITIVYDTDGATVSAFYDRDGQANTGDETVFATGLSSGTNRVVQLQTASLAPGRIRVGIIAANGTATTTAYAAGAVTLQEQIELTFLSPVQTWSVGEGTLVPVQFDTGLASFSYRVFYDQNGVFDNDEQTIAEGESGSLSTVEVDFDTSGLSVGTYYVGATVTSSAGTTVNEYAPGRVEIVSGVFIQVLVPNVGYQAAVGDVIQIVVSANDPSLPNATVRAFYDLDTTSGNGNEVTIDTFAAPEGGTTWNTQGVPAGEYYIGAELQNGMTPLPVAYSTGAVRLITGGDGGGTIGFQIIAPSADTRILAGTPYEIRWYADSAASQGTVALYRDTDLDDDNQPDGDLVELVTGLNPTSRSYRWATTGLAGRFYIVARLTLTDGTVLSATSSGRLEIRPPLFWMGDLGTSNLSGATLRGFNFQDHAGSAFTPLADVDGDGIDDFIVISQYGKPGLVNPSGTGYGEAYLIYGNRTRLEGLFDLNQTGSKPASDGSTVGATGTEGIEQGIIFSGVAIPAGSTETSGITSASMAPDMDGDGLNELIFGIAKADSLRLMMQNIGRLLFEGLLENSQQFLRGGIVIVASTNSMLADRGAVSRDFNRVIRLQEVGQAFYGSCGNPDTSDGCKIAGCGVQPCFAQVVKDGIEDDDDDHCNAFDYAEWGGRFPGYFYSWTYPPLSVPVYLCGSSTLTTTGMFRGGGSEEPYGCRILGQAAEDGSTLPDSRFGMAVSSIRSDSGHHLILISAPNHTPTPVDVPELPTERASAGVVYALATCNYWDPGDTTPVSVSRPHQYIIKTAGYSTSHVTPFGTAQDLIRRPFYMVGPTADAKISNVSAIPDFNQDGLMDVLIGSPNEGGGAGAAYVLFRRPTEIEGNYLLENLALAPTDPERLNGVMIRGEPGDRMGEALAGGGDFNGDGQQDVMIGLPNHRGGRGAVLVVFGRHDLISPEGGFAIDDMVANGHAALLVGERAGDLAGFNVASAGDMDGDSRDDLVIAAPAASPRFDSDGDGTKDKIGLDYDGDGVGDDLTNSGLPTDLGGAGLVYLVRGSNTLLGEISLSLIGTNDLTGFVFVGRSADDNLGGGQDGLGLGTRSRGLSTAGDVDNDGRSDILVSSMLADPDGKTNAGECYLIYGGISP